jgi:hypothetical protein
MNQVSSNYTNASEMDFNQQPLSGNSPARDEATMLGKSITKMTDAPNHL